MPYYSDELVEEVRSANDIVDVISGYVRLQKKGRDYFGLCPFHNERSPSFSVSQGKQMYYCFGCGAGGNALTFLMQYENATFQEALEILAQKAGIDLPKQELSGKERQEADRRARLLEINKVAAKYFYAQLRMEQGQRGMEYFANRGLSPEIMKKFGLGYSNKFSDDLYQYLRKQGYEDGILKDSGLVTIEESRGGRDKFWNRVMFPIMDVNHRVIGFGGRVMGEGEPKYLNSPETKIFDKSRNLYGLNIARSSRRPGILLCEGYMDVIALHQAGFDNAVASLGTSFTQGHASLLKRYTKEVYCTFDSDGAGTKAALRAIPILKDAGISVKIISMEPYKDPDEFIRNQGAKSYQERINNAKNSFMFEIEALEREFDLQDPESKTLFYNAIAEKILQFEEELERDNYIEAVAKLYQIGYENLRKLVMHLGTRAGFGREVRSLKSGINENKKKAKEDGIKQSQRLMLTWLIEMPELFEVVTPYIQPEDFTEELYQKAAKEVFAQYENGELNPAKIISMFTDEEQQSEIAGLFHAKLLNVETKTEREKALKETIIKVKESSISFRSHHLDPSDLEGLQKLVADKKRLQELLGVRFTLE
ncbi:DNA primase [Lachnospiraceae bacterium 3-1]|mgnify:CR=1 FL=1|nr:DNA primase [Lachnospiraceae bacterium 3-1]